MIKDVKLIIDKEKGINKGYGFIHCGNEITFERIIRTEHFVRGRKLDCNIACKKVDAPHEIREKIRKKIFVGGLSKNSTRGRSLSYQ